MSGDQVKPGEERFPQPAQLDAPGRAAQKRRNLWLGLALLGFVVLVGLTTFVRLKNSTPSEVGFYYHNGQSDESTEAPALPPGMSPDQAAPPANLTPEPDVPETEEPER